MTEMESTIQIGPKVDEVRETGAQVIQVLGMIPESSRTPEVARAAFDALVKAVRVSDVTISHCTWNVQKEPPVEEEGS
jgi:hypothetical protein